MKIFKHQGPGHYIGSVVIVTCEDIADAEQLIREYLDLSGLKDEPLNIYESEIKDISIVYAQSGDY